MNFWKLIDAFDLVTYGETMGLSEEEIENTTEYQQFYAAAFQKGNGEIVIAYRGTDGENGGYDTNFDILKTITTFDTDFAKEHLLTNGKIAAGIPGKQFEMAEWYYKKIKKIDETKSVSFTGHSLGGGLSQYAKVMSGEESALKTWNGIGVAGLGKINGYEFLGYNSSGLS